MTRHFVGSKGGSGVAQWLISLMPPHRVYVEAFLGRGVIMKTKAMAQTNIGIELDGETVKQWEGEVAANPSASIVHGNALTMLPALKTESDWLIYADPPYLLETRSCKRKYYGCELLSVQDHERLLSVLTSLPCMVMISGYRSELYSRVLKTWRCSSFWTVNRRGKRVEEIVWMNFPEPTRLHDPSFAGRNFTDRQRIKRKGLRWLKKFQAMSAGEQSHILSLLQASILDPELPAPDCGGRNSQKGDSTIRTAQPELIGVEDDCAP